MGLRHERQQHLVAVLGYNGLGRLVGQDGGPGGGPGGAGGAGGGLFGGEPGALRLLNTALGGQAGWLLGFALVAGLALVAATRLRRGDDRTGWLVAVGGSFALTAVAFSAAQGIFHPYYLSALAPFTAALVGAGASTLAQRGVSARLLAPVAVAAGVVAEVVDPRRQPRRAPVARAAARRRRRGRGGGARGERRRRWRRGALVVAG